MFVVDTAVLLPHPAPTVVRAVRRLHLLPRWCAGLRRVRAPGAARAAPADDPPRRDQECAFTYAVGEVCVTLAARTLASSATPGRRAVTHTAAGDGLTLTWTLDAEPAGAAAPSRTRLRARVAVTVDPGHPLAASRAALCRAVARRAPADLERLRTLLDRAAQARDARPAAAHAPASLDPVVGG